MLLAWSGGVASLAQRKPQAAPTKPSGTSWNGNAEARQMQADGALDVRDQCVEAGVPFHFKQWGEYSENGVRVGKKAAGRLLDGRLWDEKPGTEG